MIKIKIKHLLYGLLLLCSIQFAECKSKPKENQSSTVDSTSTTIAPADPVQISPDDSLKTGLIDATKDYPEVKASVDNGEVTLTGNLSRDKLPKLMQSVSSLHPKKINNNLTLK